MVTVCAVSSEKNFYLAREEAVSAQRNHVVDRFVIVSDNDALKFGIDLSFDRESNDYKTVYVSVRKNHMTSQNLSKMVELLQEANDFIDMIIPLIEHFEQ